MTVLIVYMLKVLLCSTILYGYYLLVLRIGGFIITTAFTCLPLLPFHG
jgi:hypothetical protein